MKIKPLYTPKEFSKITGIPLTQIYYWIKTNHLDTLQKVPGGKHYIPASEIPAFIRQQREEK